VFINFGYTIHVINSLFTGLTVINCAFHNTISVSYGIVTETTCNGTITVRNCTFNNLSFGFIGVSPINTLVITQSTFKSCEYGVQTRGTVFAFEVSDCSFNNGTYGIETVAPINTLTIVTSNFTFYSLVGIYLTQSVAHLTVSGSFYSCNLGVQTLGNVSDLLFFSTSFTGENYDIAVDGPVDTLTINNSSFSNGGYGIATGAPIGTLVVTTSAFTSYSLVGIFTTQSVTNMTISSSFYLCNFGIQILSMYTHTYTFIFIDTSNNNNTDGSTPMNMLAITSSTFNATTNGVSATTPMNYLTVFNSSFSNIGYGISETNVVGNLTVTFNTFDSCSSFGFYLPAGATSFYSASNTFTACPISIPTPSPTSLSTLSSTTSSSTLSSTTSPLPQSACIINNGGCDYRVQCYYVNNDVTCGPCPLDTIADGINNCKGI
jgi:hypothetical protein